MNLIYIYILNLIKIILTNSIKFLINYNIIEEIFMLLILYKIDKLFE